MLLLFITFYEEKSYISKFLTQNNLKKWTQIHKF